MKQLTLAILSLLIMIQLSAQKSAIRIKPNKKLYLKYPTIAPLFSTSYYKGLDTVSIFSTVRIGYHISPFELNYNFNKKIGVYTNLAFQNNGIAERYANIRYRERMMSSNLEIFAKVGNIAKDNFWQIGVSAGLGIQFRHEHWFLGEKHHTHILKDSSVQSLGNKLPFSIIAGKQSDKTNIQLRFDVTNFYTNKYLGNPLSVMHRFKSANLLTLKVGYRIFGRYMLLQK
jgi:hypothetical protein